MFVSRNCGGCRIGVEIATCTVFRHRPTTLPCDSCPRFTDTPGTLRANARINASGEENSPEKTEHHFSCSMPILMWNISRRLRTVTVCVFFRDRKPRGVISLPGCIAEAVSNDDSSDVTGDESPRKEKEPRKSRVPNGYYGLRYDTAIKLTIAQTTHVWLMCCVGFLCTFCMCFFCARLVYC